MSTPRNTVVAAATLCVAAAAYLPAARADAPRSRTHFRGKENFRVSKVAHIEPQELSAGPIRCKFADGELHYLYVGDREIVRRIYFAVRDGGWNTAMPVFTRMELRQKNGGFVIDLAADCRSDTADFSWTGRIEGTPDGKITFEAKGAANKPFRSNRIGLCVLYGAPALAGHPFETIGLDGAVHPMVFPANVQPSLVAPEFRTLRYEASGLKVATTVAGNAHFDMEDQRTYGDSSFKAYAPLDYSYKLDIPAGDELAETVTFTVAGDDKAARAMHDKVSVHIGRALTGEKLPKVTQAAPDAPGGVFGNVNGRSAQFKDATALTWPYYPTIHLPDSDNMFDNVLTVPDQVRTAHSYAPGATITLSPVYLAEPGKWPSIYTHGGDDPLQAAWSTALIHHAAIAGVSEMAFRTGPGLGRIAQDDMSAFGGMPLRAVTLEGPLPSPVDAFAIDTGGGKSVVWLVNQSDHPRSATVGGLASGPLEIRRINHAAAVGALPAETGESKGGVLRVDLAAYEVTRITVGVK